VRMIERREDLRLAMKAREPIRIARERGRQNLQRDVAIQLRIARPIHLAHTAGADGGDDFIRSESSACSEHD
jgi:hypothetical protein